MSSGEIELIVRKLWLDVVRGLVLLHGSLVVPAPEGFVALREAQALDGWIKGKLKVLTSSFAFSALK